MRLQINISSKNFDGLDQLNSRYSQKRKVEWDTQFNSLGSVFGKDCPGSFKKHVQYEERNTVDIVDRSVLNYYSSFPPSSRKHTQPRLKITSCLRQLDQTEINFVTVYEFYLFGGLLVLVCRNIFCCM